MTEWLAVLVMDFIFSLSRSYQMGFCGLPCAGWGVFGVEKGWEPLTQTINCCCCIYSITVYEPVVTFWLKDRILHVVITQSSHIIILHSIKWIRKHLPDHNKRTKVRKVWPQCGDRGHPSIPWELRPYWTMKFYIQWQHSVHMQTVVR